MDWWGWLVVVLAVYLLVGAVVVFVAMLAPNRVAGPRDLALGVLLWPVVLVNLLGGG